MKEQSKGRQITAKVLVNVFILGVDVRAVGVMYLLTESWVTALLTVLATSIPFIAWYDVFETHPTATTGQKWLDAIGTILSIVTGGVFVFADVVTKVYVDGDQITANTLGILLAIVSVLHIIGAIVWLKLDKTLKQEREIAEQIANSDFEEKMLLAQESSLLARERVLTLRQGLADQFGDKALRDVGVELPTVKKATPRKKPSDTLKAKN